MMIWEIIYENNPFFFIVYFGTLLFTAFYILCIKFYFEYSEIYIYIFDEEGNINDTEETTRRKKVKNEIDKLIIRAVDTRVSSTVLVRC